MILGPLLDNARRYADAEITISSERVGATVEVSVSDDWPGVPDDFVPVAFVPGQRADATDGHDSAGLGLALSRRSLGPQAGTSAWTPSPAPDSS